MKTLNNKTPTPKESTWRWLIALLNVLKMLLWWQKKNEKEVSTPTAAKIANVPASETSGPKSYAPSSRSQLSCWLHSASLRSARTIDLIVLHCSDTRPDQDFTVEKLAACHKARGFGEYPGYHFYVRRDGTIYNTRPIHLKGCHVKDFNAQSIGVCYEGGRTLPSPSLSREGAAKANQSPRRKYGDTRTQAQKVALRELLAALKSAFPDAKIVGHNELNPKKACPCLSPPASKEYADLTPALPV